MTRPLRDWLHPENSFRRGAFKSLATTFLLFLGTVSWGQARDHLRSDAAKAEAAGHVGQALDLYSKLLAATPEWTDGWWKYGGLLYQERRFPDAAAAFGRLTRLAPNNDLGFAMLGLCEFEEADWNNAALHLNKALNRGGLPPDILRSSAYHLGLVLMRQGNQGGALFALKVLYRQAPDYPGLSLALGAAELGMKEPPEPATAEFPAAQAAAASVTALLDGRTEDAEKGYRDLVTRFPNQPFAHLSYGLFLESKHRDDEAEKELTAETKLSPTSAMPWLWLARVALARLNSGDARSYAAHARELDPENSLPFLIEGRSLMLDREWESALVPLRVAEERDPQSSEVHYALVSVYAALHRNQDAERERQLFLASKSAEGPAEGANP